MDYSGLTDRFPRRRVVADGIWAAYTAAPVLTGGVGEPTVIGRVVEHLIVLDLGGSAAYRHLDGALPDDAADLVQTAARSPDGHGDDTVADAPTDGLVRAAWYLAYYQDILHKFGRTDKALCRSALARDLEWPFQGGAFAAALPLVHDLFAAYQRNARVQLRRLTPVLGAVELVPQRAYADLIAGRTLVEIKTGHMDVDSIIVAIDQVLRYVLLDTSETRQLTHIAIYLARAGLLYRQPLPSWLAELSGETSSPT
jgi:hypothetical protein